MSAVVDSNKENATPMEVDDDPYALSSSDSEDEGPPPMIQIAGRTAAVGDLKSSLLAKPETKAVPHQGTADELAALSQRENAAKDAFKTGQFMNEQGGTVGKEGAEEEKLEREKLTNIDKEKYSKFKNKFENIDEYLTQAEEDRKKNYPGETIHGAGADKLVMNKERFEKGLGSEEQEEGAKGPIVIERNEADSIRAKKTFTQGKQEEPTHCAVCTKMVYPVEKLLAEKNVYHKACFKCSKCAKTLAVTNYQSHQGALLCKLHMMEIFHPERAKNLKAEDMEDEDFEVDEDAEAGYAKVSRPKKLDASVVRSADMKPCEDLEKLSGTLSSAKSQWETSVEAAHKTQKTTNIESDMIQTGKVKSRLDKFTAEPGSEDEEDEEEEDPNADPNIIKSSKPKKKKNKEEIKLETGAAEMLSKWEAGKMEGAEGGQKDRTGELDEIRKGVNVKERFKERTGDTKLTEEEMQARRSKLLEETTYVKVVDEEPVPAFLRFLRHRFITSPPTSPTSTLPTPVSSEAREKFQTGDAYQDAGPIKKTVDDEFNFKEVGNFKDKFEKGQVEQAHAVEKTAIDARCEGLGGIKASFEQAKSADGNDEEKQKKIEEEFHHYKKERQRRQILEQKERDEHNALQSPDGPQPPLESDVRQCAELGDIKKRFEDGKAFQSDEPIPRSIDPQLEIKVAKKARQKFKQIDQEAPQAPVIPSSQTHADSKWNKETKAAPEPVNKRHVVESDSEDEDFEVSKLLGKFKSMGETKDDQKGPRAMRQFTPPPEGYKAELESAGGERDPNVVTGEQGHDQIPQSTAAAKNLKQKFEQGLQEDSNETAEQKRVRLEDEFKQLKQMKEQMKADEPEPEEIPVEETKEDLGIAAEHANKMKNKWEKIQKKEAKKANKSAPTRKAESLFSLMQQSNVTAVCFACGDKVYHAEGINVDHRTLHKRCFRCKVCNINLRMETCCTNDSGFFCRLHYAQHFNDMSKPLFDGRRSSTTVA